MSLLQLKVVNSHLCYLQGQSNHKDQHQPVKNMIVPPNTPSLTCRNLPSAPKSNEEELKGGVWP